MSNAGLPAIEWLKRNAANLKRFAFFNAEVGARQPVVRRRGNLASYLLLQLQPRRDVVCVNVGIPFAVEFSVR